MLRFTVRPRTIRKCRLRWRDGDFVIPCARMPAPTLEISVTCESDRRTIQSSVVRPLAARAHTGLSAEEYQRALWQFSFCRSFFYHSSWLRVNFFNKIANYAMDKNL